MSNVAVAVDNVSKSYRLGNVDVWVLKNVNLSVLRGDIVAIMGPSGSGKTTLLNMIGLLDKPTKGRVYIDGVDTSRLKERELAAFRNYKIGFVFQQFNLVGRLSVLENIELPLIARGLPRSVRLKWVLEALHKVGGDEKWLSKKPTQLSGGQQQRVAIARAIVTSPSILLADEPTGNLDRSSAKVVMATFLELNRLGQTTIIVTHDPEVANCTNKIYVIRDGAIVECREPNRGLRLVG